MLIIVKRDAKASITPLNPYYTPYHAARREPGDRLVYIKGIHRIYEHHAIYGRS